VKEEGKVVSVKMGADERPTPEVVCILIRIAPGRRYLEIFFLKPEVGDGKRP